MARPDRRDWLEEAGRHGITCACERALHAAAGINWQQLGLLASGGGDSVADAYFASTRTIIAEYLRHTGRHDEAIQIEAIGCHDPLPPASFRRMTEAELLSFQASLRGG